MQRAFRAWNGEGVVWLLPWVKKPIRWEEESGLCFLAVRSETIDRIDIFHIGQDGYVYGPGAALRFPNIRVDGLLDIWLNLHRDHAIQGVCCIREAAQIDDQVRLAVPTFHGNRVEYVEEIFHLSPRPFFPLAHLDQRGFEYKWPPEGFPSPIFPDAESYAFYEHEPPQGHSLHVQYLWPEPLRSLVPHGITSVWRVAITPSLWPCGLRSGTPQRGTGSTVVLWTGLPVATGVHHRHGWSGN